VQSSLRGSTSLWDTGLDGSDQVIQVADTGIDLKSCAISNDPAPTKWDVGAFDPTRRKVVQWVAGADAVDVASGHGTLPSHPPKLRLALPPFAQRHAKAIGGGCCCLA
jgi:hypothetical protein